MAKPKAVISWSGGKDSSMALFRAIRSGDYDIRYLVTTIDADSKCMNIHGVHESLLKAQADSIGIPLRIIYVKGKSNTAYESALGNELKFLRDSGITQIIYGDIFLDDLRSYREQFLKQYNIQAIFPLWKLNSTEILNDFFELGFEAICCASAASVCPVIAGNKLTAETISQLPAGADPCGENGEYHCFCTNGPLFSRALNIIAHPPELRSEKIAEGSDHYFWQTELAIAEI